MAALIGRETPLRSTKEPGETLVEIARSYGVSHGTISRL
jgi:hypothetical protein